MTDESLAELAGHDLDAKKILDALLERYRREGIPGLRAHIEHVIRELGPDQAARETGALIVEATLTIAESRSPRITRQRFADFEEQTERE